MSATINRRIMKHIRNYAKEHNTTVVDVTVVTTNNADITYWIEGSKALQDMQHDCIDLWKDDTDKIVKEFTSKHINSAAKEDVLLYLDVWYENDTNIIICAVEDEDRVWVVDRTKWEHCETEINAIREEARELYRIISSNTWKHHEDFQQIVLDELKIVISHCYYPPKGMGCLFGCLLNKFWWFIPYWMGGDVLIRKRLAELYIRIVQ